MTAERACSCVMLTGCVLLCLRFVLTACLDVCVSLLRQGRSKLSLNKLNTTAFVTIWRSSDGNAALERRVHPRQETEAEIFGTKQNQSVHTSLSNTHTHTPERALTLHNHKPWKWVPSPTAFSQQDTSLSCRQAVTAAPLGLMRPDTYRRRRGGGFSMLV